MAKITGGKQLAQLNRDSPNLGSLLSRILDAQNHMSKQLGVDPVGQSAAPPAPNGVDVTVTGEMAHIRITDNAPTSRAKRYTTEVHGDPEYTSPLIVTQHGASRDATVILPTNDSTGVMKAYYVRTIAQNPGSPPSAPINYPTYVTMDGTTQGDVPASSGSGTSAASGTQSAQGYGKQPERQATGVLRQV